ncbi:MAG: DNA topoisomerase IB [Labilithrix sp.]
MNQASAVKRSADVARGTGPAKKKRRVLSLDPLESAKAAALRYVDDSSPGITRKARGKSFRYFRADGMPLEDEETLWRIRRLVIPPAWTQVWICPSRDGHIQATGRDAKGRKQYRYHPRFRQIRDETKYARILAFARALPKIRAQVDADLNRPNLPREKVLASLVRLLEITLIRVGNEEYARENSSFGLTTMRTRHVDVTGTSISFHFRGKSGIEHKVMVHDRRVARVVSRCSDLPGQLLFQYVDDDGKRCSVESSDVNEYIRAIAGAEFTAKDFRTWAGTVLAAKHLQRSLGEEQPTAATVLARNVVAAIKEVSSRLGNTVAVCRKCYVHPEIVGAYLDGKLAIDDAPPETARAAPDFERLSVYETAVLSFLHRRIGRVPVVQAA